VHHPLYRLFDLPELLPQPFTNGVPQDEERSAFVASADVREAEKGEGIRLAKILGSPVSDRKVRKHGDLENVQLVSIPQCQAIDFKKEKVQFQCGSLRRSRKRDLPLFHDTRKSYGSRFPDVPLLEGAGFELKVSDMPCERATSPLFGKEGILHVNRLRCGQIDMAGRVKSRWLQATATKSSNISNTYRAPIGALLLQ
jgi:hypothetical protein